MSSKNKEMSTNSRRLQFIISTFLYALFFLCGSVRLVAIRQTKQTKNLLIYKRVVCFPMVGGNKIRTENGYHNNNNHNNNHHRLKQKFIHRKISFYP